MKKVIIVDASPRKDGNSDFITEKLAAEIKDAEIEKYYLREKPVNPCHACDACKGKDAPACVQKDEMGQLIARIDACDALIMVTPIYFNRISGPATMFIDRLYCFFDPAKPGASNATRRGKKAALICSCGGGPVDVYTSHAELTIGSFALMGADETKVHVCGDANAPGSCREHADDMKAVSEIAAWI